MTSDLAGQFRAICLALPEVTERPSHGAPTWFVRGKWSTPVSLEAVTSGKVVAHGVQEAASR
jgi:hypothetical protein